MINNYIIDINLPVNFIPYQFLNAGRYQRFQEFKIVPELVNYDFHVWLKDIGLKICPKSSRFFTRPPYMKGSIHVDSYDDHVSKINFIYDSFDAVMNWYNLLPEKVPTSAINYQKEVIRSFKPEDCEKVLTTPANNHCLINGKMLHQVIVDANNAKHRKCYSFALLDNNNNRITWDEAITKLKPYLVLN